MPPSTKQKERQKQEVKRLQNEANIQSWYDWFIKCFDLRYGEYQKRLAETLGEVVHEEHIRVRKEFKPQIDALEARIKGIGAAVLD
jgi:hypothetical protein